MATPSTPQAASRTGSVPSAHAQLDRLLAIATGHINEQLMPMIGRVVAAMLDVSDPSLDAHSVYHRVKSANLLKNNSYAWFHLACAEVERGLRKELTAVAPVRKPARATAAGPLALVPMAEMDRSVAFASISRPFEAACAEQLATLNVRLGFLLERDTLRVGQNPFRPDVILMALQQAWTGFEPELDAHGLLTPQLRPPVVFDFAPLYEALNGALTKEDPSESMRIRKTDNAARAKAERATGQAALAQQLRQLFSAGDAGQFDAGMPLIPDLPAMPAGSGGWRPSGAEAFRGALAARPAAPAVAAGGAPVAASHDGRSHGSAPYPGFAGAGPQQYQQDQQYQQQQGGVHPGHPAHAGLLDMLSRLQPNFPDPAGQPDAGPAQAPNVFYLPRLKDSLPKGSLSRGDETTIDLLSRIFETVFIDDHIPKETRELIQFLQVPVLKAALRDKEFFFQETHPARRMIDLMSRVGWDGDRGADDPLFQAMRRGVDRIAREGDAVDGKVDGKPDGEPGNAFAAAVAELEASIAAEESAVAADIAAPVAAALKQEKISAATRSAKSAVALRIGGGDLLGVVETFLANKWTAVLTIAYSVEPDKPGAVGSATRTMDDLIWSVKPKLTQEQRKQLIGKLPALLATLNKWLDIIKWQDAERLQFFAELAECHASIVRAPIDLSPERQLEIALEVAQQDAQRRIDKEQALAAAGQAAALQAETDPVLASVEGLERGMWLEFTALDVGVRTVKLAWISPLRSLFIFSTGARKEAFSLSFEKLVDAYREGSVKPVRQDGLVARALADAMGPAVNDGKLAGAA